MIAAYPEAVLSLARTRDFNEALIRRSGETFDDLPGIALKLSHKRIEDLTTNNGRWWLYYREGSDFRPQSTLGLYESEAGLTVAILRYPTHTQPYSLESVKKDLERFTKKHVERPSIGKFIYELTGDFRIVPSFLLGGLGATLLDKLTFNSNPHLANNGTFLGIFGGILALYGYITVRDRMTRAKVANLDQYFTGKHARAVLQSELTKKPL